MNSLQIQWRGRVYLNLEPSNVLVCSGRSLGKTVQVKLANFETTQTVSKSGTQIKGTYNFDYAGMFTIFFTHYDLMGQKQVPKIFSAIKLIFTGIILPVLKLNWQMKFWKAIFCPFIIILGDLLREVYFEKFNIYTKL